MPLRLVFMGTPETAVPTLRRCLADGHEVVAVWTQPDRPAGRGNRLTAPPVKEFAATHGLAVHQPTKIKTAEARALFESHAADAAVVVAYGRILPPWFLRAPRRGCVNVHFSLLPRYRGAAPVNWAIVRGETETGVTTMLMDEGLDTGPLLLQQATPIAPHETAPQLLARLADLGAELLSATLARFDELTPRPQRDEDATLAPLLTREDGLLDWTLAATDIERRVRGFQPWPNAHTLLRGARLVLWHAEAWTPPPEHSQAQPPGTILHARGDDLVIACGAGTALRVLEAQAEGKRRMSARDLLNGLRVQTGERLG
ncbi:MAG TPA: methionyl-tRNA formyltransferase [Pyrinomonadaceae bacterium]|jgi:methionyl-tRNA formyltransferase